MRKARLPIVQHDGTPAIETTLMLAGLTDLAQGRTRPATPAGRGNAQSA